MKNHPQGRKEEMTTKERNTTTEGRDIPMDLTDRGSRVPCKAFSISTIA